LTHERRRLVRKQTLNATDHSSEIYQYDIKIALNVIKYGGRHTCRVKIPRSMTTLSVINKLLILRNHRKPEMMYGV